MGAKLLLDCKNKGLKIILKPDIGQVLKVLENSTLPKEN